MTDTTTRAIAAQCADLFEGEIPDEVLRAAAVRLTDILGCAAGGSDSPPASVAKRIAARNTGTPGARVLGSPVVTTVEHAAFCNGVMGRYLDYNDTYTGTGSGHPSDMILPLLAVAESVHAPGDRLLRAVVTGYEAYGVIAKSNSVRSRGWDQGVMTGLGAAVGSALLLGCGVQELEHAVGLAVTMAVPTRATRAGALSMWKGAATAASARFGVFAAQLAADGMTSPDRAIEGKDGQWQQVTGTFEVRPFGGTEPWMVRSTAIKQYPVEYNAQIAIEIVRALREKEGLRAADVAELSVDTYWTSYDEIGNEPEKWAPTTRETADHSLPYLLATALVHGEVTADSFDEAHLRDPEVRALLKTVSVHEDPEFTARWPAAMPCRLTVTTRDGRTFAAERDQPLGHRDRPLPQSAVDEKFRRLTSRLVGAERAEHALDRLRSVGLMADSAEILDLFAPAGPPPGPLA